MNRLQVSPDELMFAMYADLLTDSDSLDAARASIQAFWNLLRPGKPYEYEPFPGQLLYVDAQEINEYLEELNWVVVSPEYMFEMITEGSHISEQEAVESYLQIEPMGDHLPNAMLITHFGKYLVNGDEMARWIESRQ